MSYITLSEAKVHLNIESGFTQDDLYINDLIGVAEQAVDDYLNGGMVLSGYTGNTINKAIKHSMLLYISHLYVTRSLVSYVQGYEIPMAFKFLLNPYRNYTIS